MVYNTRWYILSCLVVALIVMFPTSMSAKESSSRFYRMEVGAQVGASYYVGELAPYVFLSTAEAYGAQFRYKIDPRWALQLKGQRQRVVNNVEDDNLWRLESGKYVHPMWHVDVVGEYNFFQLGLDEYNIHMRPWTPYMFVGFGLTFYEDSINNRGPSAVYVPVGLGVKWKFADRWQLQFAWQHNVYLVNGDGLEGVIDARRPNLFNDSYKMNGSNIMNNDVTSTLTLGVVFEFGCQQRKCVFCDYKD